MSERIAKAGAEFGQAIADELAAIRRDMLTKEDAKQFLTKEDAKQFLTKDDAKAFLTKDDAKNFATKDDIKMLVNLINDHTIALREELNFQFKKAKVPVELSVKPRKRA